MNKDNAAQYLPLVQALAEGETMNCPHCSAPLIYSDGVRCGMCNNLVSEPARPDADSVRVQRVDMRHQPWSAEVPRASGVWWWWHPDKMRQPTIVEVAADVYVTALYGSPTFQFVGLTLHRVCSAEGGWWAGPLEWDKVPDGAVPHIEPSSPTARRKENP